MSTAIAKNFQVGNDSTATNNFTIRQPATPDGTVRIANGNTGTTTDLVTVTSAGNVGIGTSSPSNATLDVVANANTVALAVRGRSSDNLSGIVFRSNNAATEYAYLQGGATYLAVGVNAAERMRVDGSGNLMIGGTTAFGKTTSYTNFGNSYGSSYTARALGTAQGQLAGYSFNPTFQGTADNVPRRAADIWSGFNSGAWTTEFLAFGVGTGAANDAGNATTERMRITGSGNVGIGTSSPGVRADINGVMRSSTWSLSGTGVTGGTSAFAAGTVSTDSNWGMYFRAPTSSSAIAEFSFRNSVDTERARIDSSGNLLVGTTSAWGGTPRIHGEGSSSNWSVSASNTGSNSGFGAFLGRVTDVVTPLAGWYYNTGQVGTITTNGSSTSYNTSSDYRLKENIKPMIGALEKVAQLKPCIYTWKATGAAGQGFIAHELQDVVPDAVVGEKDAVNEDGSIRPQNIDTSFLVATLTAAIQELNAKVESLTTELNTLKGS